MRRHHACRWTAATAAVVVLWANAPGRAGQASGLPPPERTVHYTDTNGVEHLYLVQEPRGGALRPDAPVLIYMHGAGGEEEQGMHRLFPRLRPLLDSWGWVYVCPRDDDFAGLRHDLEARYGKRKLYLSGASAGGRAAFLEALAHPTSYSGLVLMCPAVVRETIPRSVATDASRLPMPVWMICGERDMYYAATCRYLQQVLERRHQPVFYVQIPGGSHDDPCLQIRWEDALRFITASTEQQGDGRGEGAKRVSNGPRP